MASDQPGIQPNPSSKLCLVIFFPVSLYVDKSHALGVSRGAFFFFFLSVVKILKDNQKGKDKDVSHLLADVRL